MKKEVILQLNQYNHSRGIIFSHIEGQFPSDIFLSKDQSFGILFTTFDYHYAFGSVPSDLQEFHQAIVSYQHTHNKDELVLFGPNPGWEVFLTSWTHRIHGVIDSRNQYTLNKEQFLEFDPYNNQVTIEFIQDDLSTIQVPQATVHLHGKDISFAKALMIGNKLAEVEVWTDKQYRKQGFGFDSSLLLIKHLLDNDLTPIWSCWQKKTISNSLAKKLCFELEFNFPAFVWVKDFGPL